MSSSKQAGRPRPHRLPTSYEPKPWGSRNLAPWYPPPHEKIGEVWFQADLPLLVKFIFTTGRLSVQVHPDDDFAAKHENSPGKTEMWHILRAEPGAQIALGFREPITAERLERSAKSGEIVHLLNWIGVSSGETFFVPAGTIHAIGSGLILCEIQQHSNITYRIYDYGSDRELHLDKAIQVCDTSALDPRPVALPVDCRYFHTEALRVNAATEFEPDPARFELLIFHQGQGRIAGEDFHSGETWLVPAGAAPFRIDPSRDTNLLRTWVPRGEP